MLVNVQCSALGKGQGSTHNLLFCIFLAPLDPELLSKTESSHNKHFFSHMNIIDFPKEALEGLFCFCLLFNIQQWRIYAVYSKLLYISSPGITVNSNLYYTKFHLDKRWHVGSFGKPHRFHFQIWNILLFLFLFLNDLENGLCMCSQVLQLCLKRRVGFWYDDYFVL